MELYYKQTVLAIDFPVDPRDPRNAMRTHQGSQGTTWGQPEILRKSPGIPWGPLGSPRIPKTTSSRMFAEPRPFGLPHGGVYTTVPQLPNPNYKCIHPNRCIYDPSTRP